MHKNKIAIYRIICVLSIFLLSGCSYEEPSLKETYMHTFRLAESHPKSHPTAQADLEFARRVEEETDGRIKIIVYFDKDLGEEKDVTKLVSYGAIDFARVSIAPMAEIVDELYVLQLPYIYEDRDHMFRVLNSEIGDEMIEKIREHGMIGLTWFDAGARSFYTSSKPIRQLEDLNKQIIRLQENSLTLDMSKAMNFQGVVKPYGEVFSLLQKHEVDGAENNFSSYLTSSHYKVAKYYTMDEHVRVPELIIASDKILQEISSSDWEIIGRVAKETTEYQKKLWTEMEEKAKEQLIDEGVVIIQLEDRSSFVEAVQPIYEKYEEKYGDLIRRIKSK